MLGKCDYINDFKNKIGNKSCYHDIELLNLFNEYKFVFVSENSVEDGYVTEKIFNVFFSRTIPLYYGSRKITYYFNSESFINLNDYYISNDYFIKIKNVKNLIDYKKYFSYKIINDSYDNENYIEKLNNFIDKYK